MESFNYPLSNHILLVFHYSCFHGEMSDLRTTYSPDIIRRYLHNYDDQQKISPIISLLKKIDKKKSILRKKSFFHVFRER